MHECVTNLPSYVTLVYSNRPGAKPLFTDLEVEEFEMFHFKNIKLIKYKSDGVMLEMITTWIRKMYSLDWK